VLLSQICANAIIAGANYFLIAIGFSIIYSTTRFFHFAHGAIFTLGAYFTFFLKVWLGFPFLFALPFAIILSTLVGCLIEIFIYRPLRLKCASSLILLLVSLGTYVFLQNMVSLAFGDDTKSIRSGVMERTIHVLGANITYIQLIMIFGGLFLLITMTVFLNNTLIGKAMRAVANDKELAMISGIESDRIILWAFIIGSALAGMSGILVALDVGMNPTMGMNALMMGIVAVIIGGVSSITGVALGALLLGTAQHLAVWKIGSQWQDAIAFFILLIFLLFKPEGFLGKKVRKATV